MKTVFFKNLNISKQEENQLLRMLRKFILLIVFLAFSAITFPASISDNNSEYVDLFMGTAGDHGQVDPAASIPYGMIRICPDMDPRSHSGYDFDVNHISGFSINRISGIGCSGAGGNFRIKPARINNNLQLIKETEKAIPGFYSVWLDNGVQAEFTVDRAISFERFTFPKDAETNLTLDVSSSFNSAREYAFKIISDTEIEGFVRSGNTCNHGEYKLYFNLRVSSPFEVVDSTEKELEIIFKEPLNRQVEVRIAVSAISQDIAQNENKLIENTTFDQIRIKANNQWNKLLSRIEIEGASLEDKKLFYTSLYRVFLSPANVTSYNNLFLGTDGIIRESKDYTYYSSWSMWDSYRTKFPLITLLDPSTMKDICQSLINLYLYGKEDWATPFESTPTVRTEHSIPVLLDAYLKGVPVDLESAYESFSQEIDSLKIIRPDQSLEACIDLLSLSEVASILGKKEDTKHYAEWSKALFHSAWEQDFKTITDDFKQMKGSGLYQGTRWQYRWAIPQYLDVMAVSVGGKEVLREQLDTYFNQNLSNQTNEPGLHNPYLYNRLGYPEKAQTIVRKILTQPMTHLYGGNSEYAQPVIRKTFELTPEGFLPEMDEDDGTMSAYYVFGAIGLYPLIVGEPSYEITSPLYETTTLRLANKKSLIIKVKNRQSIDAPIRKIYFNEQEIKEYRIKHQDLFEGGLLTLEY